jgi:ATP-binding cassette, subfamily B, bacterial
MTQSDCGDPTNLNRQLQTLLSRAAYLPKTLTLIGSAAGAWTTVWAVILTILGLLPVASVYLTRALINDLVAIQGRGMIGEALRPTLGRLGLLAGVMILTQVLQSLLNWVRSAQA